MGKDAVFVRSASHEHQKESACLHARSPPPLTQLEVFAEGKTELGRSEKGKQ